MTEAPGCHPTLPSSRVSRLRPWTHTNSKTNGPNRTARLVGRSRTLRPSSRRASSRVGRSSQRRSAAGRTKAAGKATANRSGGPPAVAMGGGALARAGPRGRAPGPHERSATNVGDARPKPAEIAVLASDGLDDPWAMTEPIETRAGQPQPEREQRGVVTDVVVPLAQTGVTVGGMIAAAGLRRAGMPWVAGCRAGGRRRGAWAARPRVSAGGRTCRSAPCARCVP